MRRTSFAGSRLWMLGGRDRESIPASSRLPVPPRPLRLRPLPVRQRRRRQAEVVLRRLLHPLGLVAPPLLQGLAAHPLGEAERLRARRVEPPRRRVFLPEH